MPRNSVQSVCPAARAFSPRLAPCASRTEARRPRRRCSATSNPLFDDILCRSMADLAMLNRDAARTLPLCRHAVVSTTFGRDGLITAMQMLWVDPRIARGILRRLVAFQAQTTDAYSDAEPGKIRTRCVPARWRHSEKCPSASTMEASIPPRFLCCWLGCISSVPATSIR